jgi:hypothetical protein
MLINILFLQLFITKLMMAGLITLRKLMENSIHWFQMVKREHGNFIRVTNMWICELVIVHEDIIPEFLKNNYMNFSEPLLSTNMKVLK